MQNKVIDPVFNPPRCTGRSTRLADHYIQELFMKGRVEIQDHCDHWQARQILFDRVIMRLRIEHQHVKIAAKRSTYSIWLEE